jgi:DNA-binding transcriptional regulator YhcF (GntR family)
LFRGFLSPVFLRTPGFLKSGYGAEKIRRGDIIVHSPTVARPRSNLHRNPESLSNLNLKVDSENIKQPLYVKLRQMLRQRILQDFQEGEQFYSERDLLEKLSASQPTIRRALRDLTTEGYLVADPRRGYFVNHRAETCYVGVIQPAFGSILHIQLGAELTAICREKTSSWYHTIFINRMKCPTFFG